MTDAFSFRLIATDGTARRGEIATPHGAVQTPAFMPVGTQATVKGLTPETVRDTGAEILLGNTYHLMLRPGAERIAALGGLHKFMNWPRPILTDSGGFQVMSLSELRNIDENKGVTFRSHIDGAMVELSPERAIEIQTLLGADIVMQLDECIKLPNTHGGARARDAAVAGLGRALQARLRERAARPRAVRHRAGRRRFRAARAKRAGARRISDFTATPSAGSRSASRRRSCSRSSRRPRRCCRPTGRAISWASARREDLLEAVARGIDMFDCVLPTRNGRHGAVFTRFGQINLDNARHRDDPRPLDEQSPYETTRTYSRAYLHHLVRVNEMLGAMLLSAINLAYYQELMAGMRDAIERGRFAEFRAQTREGWEKGDLPPV